LPAGRTVLFRQCPCGSGHPSPRPRRKPAGKPFASKANSSGRDLQDPLADITGRLKVIGAVTVTAEIALRTQTCEQDADIAECLRHGVVDALTTKIERLSRL
jgi:hypothetical protein